MKNIEKRKILHALPIAYFSGFGGIEIKGVEYGINDYVLFVAGAWCSNRTAHRARIDSNNKGCYFRYCDTRIYLDECIRC